MKDIKNRKRKIDVERLSVDQIDKLTQRIVDEISKVYNNAEREVDEIVTKYGLEDQVKAVIQWKLMSKKDYLKFKE